MIRKNVAHSGERGGIIHSRRHLAASSLFKGLPDFKKVRVAMLRTESVDELFEIMDTIPEQFQLESNN